MRANALAELEPVRAVGTIAPARVVGDPAAAHVDSVSISHAASVLGRLSELATTSPEGYRSLLEQGAAGAHDANLEQAAAALSAAAAAGNPSPLVPFLTSDPERAFAYALQLRVEAALGLRAPPFGPWFSR